MQPDIHQINKQSRNVRNDQRMSKQASTNSNQDLWIVALILNNEEKAYNKN